LLPKRGYSEYETPQLTPLRSFPIGRGSFHQPQGYAS